MHKPGRNDPCSCGSGKKYKKCCELLGKHKKFQAAVLPTMIPETAAQEANKVSSLFFRSAVQIAPEQKQESSTISAMIAKNVQLGS